MTHSLFPRAELSAPYYIFIRCGRYYSDADLLDSFGLGSYRRTEEALRFQPYAILADDGEWTLLADDYRYTLWHKQSTRDVIAELGEHWDVFACSVGDCDHSFDFDYYRDSRLVRRYIVADPDFQSRVVVENVGDPLPGESAAIEHTNELDVVLTIAASLGIKTHYKERELRVYAP